MVLEPAWGFAEHSTIRRVPASTDPETTCRHDKFIVHLQGKDSRAPGWCETDDVHLILAPRKVLRLGIEPWVE
jgi:hypothetical protein